MAWYVVGSSVSVRWRSAYIAADALANKSAFGVSVKGAQYIALHLTNEQPVSNSNSGAV